MQTGTFEERKTELAKRITEAATDCQIGLYVANIVSREGEVNPALKMADLVINKEVTKNEDANQTEEITSSDKKE